LIRHGDIEENRLDWAFGHASLAIDALFGVDKELHFIVVKALARTNGNAVGVLAVMTRFANYKRHGGAPIIEGKGIAMAAS
jgi:hypothetical protein